MRDRDYLTKVLLTWNEFNRTHQKLSKALKNLISDNIQLAKENCLLKEKVAELEKEQQPHNG